MRRGGWHEMVPRGGASARIAVTLIAVVMVVACTSDPAPEAAVDEGEQVEQEEPAAREELGGEGGSEELEAAAEGGEVVSAADPVTLDLDLEERVADGTTMRVSGLEVTEDVILVDVEIVVAAERAFITLDQRTQSTPATVRDDVGNEYLLDRVDGNISLRLSGGERLEGTLAFEGPLHEDAESVEIVFNEDSDPEGRGQRDRIYPHFVFGPIALDGSGVEDDRVEAAEPVVVEVDLEERVADGTTMRVTRLEVTELAILVDVDLVVASERTNVWLDNQMSTPALVRDDQGEEYRLTPVEGNSSLRVRGGERLEGTLSFQGPLRDGVESLEVVFNEDRDPEQSNSNDRRYPHFVFGPIDLR